MIDPFTGATTLPQRVAILRALPGLGDFLCITPALRALRTTFPEAHISLIGLPSPLIRGLVRRFGGTIDELIQFPGWPGLPEQAIDVRRIMAFLTDIQTRELDLALQLHGSGGIVNPLMVMLGAKRTAGFYLPDSYCPDPDSFLIFENRAHEALRPLQLLEHLGIPSQGNTFEFPLQGEDFAALASIPDTASLAWGAYVCIHPGASRAIRRWPAESFALVGDAIARQTGLRVVLTGTIEEAPLTQAVAQCMETPSIDLAGRTSLGALAALLTGSRLVLSTDTGIAHLAYALGIPSVTIFLTSSRDRWAALDEIRHRAVGAGTPADIMGEFELTGNEVPTEQVIVEALEQINKYEQESRIYGA